MSTALLLLLLQYAPSASMHLVDTAEVASLTDRLERLETELEKMPEGWPVGAIAGAALGYGIGAPAFITGVVIVFSVASATGEGLVLVLGLLVAGVALLPQKTLRHLPLSGF